MGCTGSRTEESAPKVGVGVLFFGRWKERLDQPGKGGGFVGDVERTQLDARHDCLEKSLCTAFHS